MNIKDAYNNWASQYDTNINKTRDLEALALRENLEKVAFKNCLEIGCGTGKNTTWLITKTENVIAVDLSEEMLAKAKMKVTSERVTFIQGDINLPWSFITKPFDLICFSLVLEHIQDLDSIFRKAAEAIAPGGHVYVGELHPFKQYAGSKARFETENGQQVVTCYNHNISDFTQSAKKYGFEITDVKEYFDENNNQTIPRILTLIFKKTN